MATKKSPIDELYYNLYGHNLPKAGQAYERIVAGTFKLLLKKDIEYDQMLRGGYSNTVYQLDGSITTEANSSMIEAKDYTAKDKKVGRDDIQKMQGALTDLTLNEGFFASATDYTSPAKKYAASSKANPLHKPIELYNIRPSTERDEEGRLRKLVFTTAIHSMDITKLELQPIFTEDAKQKLRKAGYGQKSAVCNYTFFYDKEGHILISLQDLCQSYPPGTTWEDGFISCGCWLINNSYILVDNILFEIRGIEYKVPFVVTENQSEFESKGKPTLLVKSEDDHVNKLIYDDDLRKLKFENGKVILK